MSAIPADNTDRQTNMSGFIQSLNITFSDTVARNRKLFDESLEALRDETLALADRRLDRGKTAIERWRQNPEMVDLIGLQHEWLTDFARDYYDGTMRTAGRMQKLWLNGFAVKNGAMQVVSVIAEEPEQVPQLPVPVEQPEVQAPA